jgi:hypothetical protein
MKRSGSNRISSLGAKGLTYAVLAVGTVMAVPTVGAAPGVDF